MRKIKIAAMQPAYISAPRPYNVYGADYENDVKKIVEQYVRKQLEVTASLLEQAGEQKCDLAVTCEDITGLMDYSADVTDKNIFRRLVIETAPLAEKMAAGFARTYSMYVVASYFKEIDGKIFGIGAVFDRSGAICGEYRKTHLPPNEKWQCESGDALEPIETEFGRIGICICYDMMFPEVVETLALKGAEIIAHPTLNYGWYDEIGEATLRTRANDNSVYIITSKSYDFNRAGRSSITDQWGHIRADAGYHKNVIAVHEIDLDCQKSQPEWYNPVRTGGGVSNVKKRKLMERRPELYGELVVPRKEELPMMTVEEKKEVFEELKQGVCSW